MSAAIEFAVLLLFVPLVVTLHEAGHAAMARPAGYRLTSFGIGRGRPLVQIKLRGGAVLTLGQWVVAGGTCVAVPRGLGVGPKAALYHAGGLLAQLLLAGALALAPQWWWVEAVARFNWLVLAFNLVPWRIQGVASDGWWILATLGNVSALSGQLYTRRRVLERMLGYEQRAGSVVGTWYCELMLHWIDLLVGRDPSDWFDRDKTDWVGDVELDALHHYARAEWHRLSGHPLASMRLLRELRQVHGAALPEASSDLVSIAEARTWLALDEPRAARVALARVAGVGGVVGQDAAAVLVQAALDEDDLSEVERSARRLAGRMGGTFLDAPEAVQVLWRAALALKDAGRDEAHTDLARVARRTAAQLLAAADPGDRASLIRRLGEPAGLRATG